MLEEKISKRLGVPYIYIPNKRIFLCENGVPFTKEEYKHIDMKAEYERRKESDELYDYVYAKNTGVLRKKRGLAKRTMSDYSQDSSDDTQAESLQEVEKASETKDSRVRDTVYEHRRAGVTSKSILTLCFALVLVALGSMWISTLHTATYLLDYFGTISAWIMSSIITMYSATAFEVVIIFWDRKRYFISVVFSVLWAMVVVFSMMTTVSVFYERFNFNKLQNTEVNKEVDSSRLALQILQTEEKALREEIEFKRDDIKYRQSMDYATNARTLELNELQNKLQQNLREQKDLLLVTPDASKEETEVTKKETFFDFLSRLTGIDSGVVEFIMSILSAIFINLIAPFTVSTVVTLTGGSSDESSSNK